MKYIHSPFFLKAIEDIMVKLGHVYCRMLAMKTWYKLLLLRWRWWLFHILNVEWPWLQQVMFMRLALSHLFLWFAMGAIGFWCNMFKYLEVMCKCQLYAHKILTKVWGSSRLLKPTAPKVPPSKSNWNPASSRVNTSSLNISVSTSTNQVLGYLAYMGIKHVKRCFGGNETWVSRYYLGQNDFFWQLFALRLV